MIAMPTSSCFDPLNPLTNLPLHFPCLCDILILRDLRGRVQFPTGGEADVRSTDAKPASLPSVAT